MANMFDTYPDVPEETTTPINGPISKAERQRVLKKKDLKVLKKLAKALRKQNKLMQEKAEKQKAEEEAAKKAADKETNRHKDDSGAKGFFNKLGDAICKAIPKVLTTIATVALGFFFKTRFAGKAQQAA